MNLTQMTIIFTTVGRNPLEEMEMNRDHSVVFEIASKYCNSDSFLDSEGYSISFKEFLNGFLRDSTGVYIMVI